jgi:hypothetical protein
MQFCNVWSNSFLCLFVNKRVSGLCPGTWNVSMGNCVPSVLLHRPTALVSSLQLTYRWYADGTRNWQRTPANAQYESCLAPLPHPLFGRSPSTRFSFGLRTYNSLFCLGLNLYFLYMSFLGVICNYDWNERVWVEFTQLNFGTCQPLCWCRTNRQEFVTVAKFNVFIPKNL